MAKVLSSCISVRLSLYSQRVTGLYHPRVAGSRDDTGPKPEGEYN